MVSKRAWAGLVLAAIFFFRYRRSGDDGVAPGALQQSSESRGAVGLGEAVTGTEYRLKY